MFYPSVALLAITIDVVSPRRYFAAGYSRSPVPHRWRATPVNTPELRCDVIPIEDWSVPSPTNQARVCFHLRLCRRPVGLVPRTVDCLTDSLYGHSECCRAVALLLSESRTNSDSQTRSFSLSQSTIDLPIRRTREISFVATCRRDCDVVLSRGSSSSN